MLSRDHFRAACGKYATGITVATVLEAAGQPHGVTVNSFTSVSLDPPIILFCLDRRAVILNHFQASRRFAINVLCEEQREISGRFARAGIDRFEGIEWTPGETGVPLLPGSLVSLECTLSQTVEAGDHLILLGEVSHLSCREG